MEVGGARRHWGEGKARRACLLPTDPFYPVLPPPPPLLLLAASPARLLADAHLPAHCAALLRQWSDKVEGVAPSVPTGWSPSGWKWVAQERDPKGWFYSERFAEPGFPATFYPMKSMASQVRRRKYQRLVTQEPVTQMQQVSVLWHEHQHKLVNLIKAEKKAELRRKKLQRHARTDAEVVRLEGIFAAERIKSKELIKSTRDQTEILSWEAARLHGLTEY